MVYGIWNSNKVPYILYGMDKELHIYSLWEQFVIGMSIMQSKTPCCKKVVAKELKKAWHKKMWNQKWAAKASGVLATANGNKILIITIQAAKH